jgi:hypothetical protein
MKHVLYFIVGLIATTLLIAVAAFLLFWRQWIYDEPTTGAFMLWNLLQAGFILVAAGAAIFISGSVLHAIYEIGKDITKGISRQINK